MKETFTQTQIKQKKQELLKHGIPLDMPFIQKLTSDEALARQNVENLQTWIPVLYKLRKDYKVLLAKRWKARDAVGNLRVAFATRSTRMLQDKLSDLFVSVKFDRNALAPDVERLVIEAMGWRTLQ